MRAAVFGASGGIGAALVRLLAGAAGQQRPDVVFALARDPSTCPAMDGVVSLPFALEDEPAIAAAAVRMGQLDLCIVASGVLTMPDGAAPEKSLRALDPAMMLEAFRLNTVGPALIAKHVLPLFARDRRAVFAALSARVGSIGDNRLGGWHSYRASKAALNMVIRTCAVELARTRPLAICAALHPGTVDTGLSAPFQTGLRSGQLRLPAEAAHDLLVTINGLEPADSGGFFAWDGSPVPY